MQLAQPETRLFFMDIRQETQRLLEHRLLGTFDSKEYVNWAAKLILVGQESESLMILAGMGKDSTEEREKYFWKSVDELKIETSKIDRELINDYALKLAEQVVSRQVEPKIGLSKMLEIIKQTDDDEKYTQFYQVDEEIDQWSNNSAFLFDNEPLTDGIDDQIIQEFQAFIKTNSR